MFYKLFFIFTTLYAGALFADDAPAFEDLFTQCSSDNAQYEICKYNQTDLSQKPLIQLNREYKKIAVASGVSEEDQFLVNFKTSVNEKLQAQVKSLTDFKDCIRSGECESQKSHIRQQLKKNWKKMRRAIALMNQDKGNIPSKKTKTARGIRSQQLPHPSLPEIKYNVQSRNNKNKRRYIASKLNDQFPIVRHNQLKHIKGLDFTDSISPLSPDEVSEANNSFQRSFNLDLEQNISNDTKKLIANELKELRKSEDTSKGIAYFLKIINEKFASAKNKNAPIYKAVQEVIEFSKKRIITVRKQADKDYLESLKDNPILAYIDNFDPNNDNIPSDLELSNAVQKIIDKATKLQEKALNKLNISDALFEFAPVAQELLAQDESSCGVAKLVFDRKATRDRRFKYWTKKAKTVGSAACFAAIWFPVAGVTICGLGYGLDSVVKGLAHKKQKGLTAGLIGQSFADANDTKLTNKRVDNNVNAILGTKKEFIDSSKETAEAVGSALVLVSGSAAISKAATLVKDSNFLVSNARLEKLATSPVGKNTIKYSTQAVTRVRESAVVGKKIRDTARAAKVILPIAGRFAPRTIATGAVNADSPFVNNVLNRASLNSSNFDNQLISALGKQDPCNKRYSTSSSKLTRCISFKDSGLKAEDINLAFEVFDSIKDNELNYGDDDFSELMEFFEEKPSRIRGAKNIISTIKGRSSNEISKRLKGYLKNYEKEPSVELKFVIELSKMELEARKVEEEKQTKEGKLEENGFEGL